MSILTKTEASKSTTEGVIKELFKLGAHFGFSRSRRHPSTDRFIFGFKNRQSVIDLEQTAAALAASKEFVHGLGAAGKLLLLVGSKAPARGSVAAGAMTAGLPYVAERWLGGTLTNFKELRRRTNRLLKLREEEASGDLMIYTKKERGVIAIEQAKLERYFSSLIPLTELPGALFVVDANDEAIAVAEAKKLKIPVITLSNSDCDIRGLAYPIIGNDASQANIRYFIDELIEAYQAGRAVHKEAVLKAAEVAPAVI
ncbi:MAG: 30S ribosomal protein S2 [bacterium]|nr:30S ribosomal protein S2 [bacterium]